MQTQRKANETRTSNVQGMRSLVVIGPEVPAVGQRIKFGGVRAVVRWVEAWNPHEPGPLLVMVS